MFQGAPVHKISSAQRLHYHPPGRAGSCVYPIGRTGIIAAAAKWPGGGNSQAQKLPGVLNS